MRNLCFYGHKEAPFQGEKRRCALFLLGSYPGLLSERGLAGVMEPVFVWRLCVCGVNDSRASGCKPCLRVSPAVLGGLCGLLASSTDLQWPHRSR